MQADRPSAGAVPAGILTRRQITPPTSNEIADMAAALR